MKLYIVFLFVISLYISVVTSSSSSPPPKSGDVPEVCVIPAQVDNLVPGNPKADCERAVQQAKGWRPQPTEPDSLLVDENGDKPLGWSLTGVTTRNSNGNLVVHSPKGTSHVALPKAKDVAQKVPEKLLEQAPGAAMTFVAGGCTPPAALAAANGAVVGAVADAYVECLQDANADNPAGQKVAMCARAGLDIKGGIDFTKNTGKAVSKSKLVSGLVGKEGAKVVSTQAGVNAGAYATAQGLKNNQDARQKLDKSKRAAPVPPSSGSGRSSSKSATPPTSSGGGSSSKSPSTPPQSDKKPSSDSGRSSSKSATPPTSSGGGSSSKSPSTPPQSDRSSSSDSKTPERRSDTSKKDDRREDRREEHRAAPDSRASGSSSSSTSVPPAQSNGILNTMMNNAQVSGGLMMIGSTLAIGGTVATTSGAITSGIFTGSTITASISAGVSTGGLAAAGSIVLTGPLAVAGLAAVGVGVAGRYLDIWFLQLHETLGIKTPPIKQRSIHYAYLIALQSASADVKGYLNDLNDNSKFKKMLQTNCKSFSTKLLQSDGKTKCTWTWDDVKTCLTNMIKDKGDIETIILLENLYDRGRLIDHKLHQHDIALVTDMTKKGNNLGNVLKLFCPGLYVDASSGKFSGEQYQFHMIATCRIIINAFRGYKHNIRNYKINLDDLKNVFIRKTKLSSKNKDDLYGFFGIDRGSGSDAKLYRKVGIDKYFMNCRNKKIDNLECWNQFDMDMNNLSLQLGMSQDALTSNMFRLGIGQNRKEAEIYHTILKVAGSNNFQFTPEIIDQLVQDISSKTHVPPDVLFKRSSSSSSSTGSVSATTSVKGKTINQPLPSNKKSKDYMIPKPYRMIKSMQPPRQTIRVGTY